MRVDAVCLGTAGPSPSCAAETVPAATSTISASCVRMATAANAAGTEQVSYVISVTSNTHTL